MLTITDKLKELFSDADHIEMDSFEGGIRVRIGAMYESPKKSDSKTIALKDFFGCEVVLYDTFSYGGCETCDYGSQYGYFITIIEPTQNIYTGGHKKFTRGSNGWNGN